MGRSPCCSKEGLNRGAWTAFEDKLLTAYITANGEGKWRDLPKRAGLKRCGKSCRLRWLNYLRPDIKRGNISYDEEELIIRLHKLLGNRWSLIAGRLPGRTDNEIKNYWNTTLRKRVKAETSTETPSHKKLTAESQVTGPSNSPQANETKAQVIQTKATRCSRKVMIPSPTTPTRDIDTSNRTLQDSSDLPDYQLYLTHNDQGMDDSGRVLQIQHGTEVLPELYGDGSSFLNFGINDLLQGISNEEYEENNNDISKYQSEDLVQQVAFDEAMFKDWTTFPCLDDTTVDFDSLAFSLDPDEGT